MRKQLLILIALSVGLSGNAVAKPHVFKIATLAPDSTAWMQHMRDGAKEIEQLTEGRVKLKFYPGGIMGNDQAVLRKIRIRQLQGGAVTTGAISKIYPDAQIYSLPMQFESIEEVNFVRKVMDQDLRAGIRKKGLVMLGISNGGFAYVASMNPVAAIDDLRKQRVWLPQGDVIGAATFEAAEISPVPLALPDVYTALQTGLLDTIIANPSSIIAFQWHTKIKYITDAPLLFLMGAMVVDRKAFDKLAKADQKVMQDIMRKKFSELDEINYRDNIAARDALKEGGVEIVAVSDEKKKKWREITEKAITSLHDSNAYSLESLAKLRKIRKQYRDQVKK